MTFTSEPDIGVPREPAPTTAVQHQRGHGTTEERRSGQPLDREGHRAAGDDVRDHDADAASLSRQQLRPLRRRSVPWP